MGDAYREMPDVLGENEREEEAIRKLGRWRERTRAKVALVFALLGLVPAAPTAAMSEWAATIAAGQ